MAKWPKPKTPRKPQLRDVQLLSDIAVRLKEIRESKGLTLNEVYNETDIHVGRIETGKSNMSVSVLNAICKYYKVSLRDFFKDH